MVHEAHFPVSEECAPTLLAEHLSYEVACAGLRRYGTKQSAEGLLRSAWHHAEFALSHRSPIDDDIRLAYINYTQMLLGDALIKPRAHADTQLGALVLSSYMTCLRKRALTEEVLPADCAQIYQSLGAAIQYLQPLDIHQPPQWRMMETVVLAASARIGRPEFLMYPGSPREEASPAAQYNHDGYFVADGTKLAIQQKLIPTNKDYDPAITILVLEPILRRAYKKAGIVHGGALPERLNYILALIVSETHGHTLTAVEHTLLSHLSSAVAHHRIAAERTVMALAS